MNKLIWWSALAVSTAMLFSGCARPQQARTEFSMGENVPVGQITYVVVESAWRNQLGESFRVRTPQQRFLLLKLSVTNGTGQDISVPQLTLEGPTGQTYRELATGEGVENWFGVLRTISPGQNQQGYILFDVPLTSYKLRVPDVGDAGLERYVSVQIPLQINSDVPIQSPIDPQSLK